MNKHKSETQKMQQIFHFDEQNIEKICASLESGMYHIILDSVEIFFFYN